MEGDDGDDPLFSDSPGAFDDLVQSAGPASLLVVIQSRMGRLLRERTTAEDIFQEALLHAWRDRRRLEWRGRKSFRAWLLSIIDNRLRDATAYEGARKRGGGASPIPLDGRAADASDDASVGAPPTPIASTTPSRLALYKETAAAMQEALQALPDELRDVVRLRVFEQLPLPDVAARLGLGLSAVAHRFRKGAERYHRLLSAAMTSRGLSSDGVEGDVLE